MGSASGSAGRPKWPSGRRVPSPRGRAKPNADGPICQGILDISARRRWWVSPPRNLGLARFEAMVLLMLFGFVAGAGTALSPCVLPVLPIALSAGATGGRRRPLGVVVGLAVSFTFATVALVYVISALGLPDDLLRKLAIAALLAFGVSLMIPPLAARIEATMSRFAGRVGVARRGGDGFWSGVLVGASLGLVYAPCAGPILAGVITVSASQSFTAGRLAVALSYGLGSAVVLYFLMLGG